MADINSILDSQSDSDSEINTCILLYQLSTCNKKKSKICRSDFLKIRQTHGEFVLSSEFSDEKFTNYFRINRDQFIEVHSILQSSIYSEGCNAKKPIGTEEKLAVFLRYVATGDNYKSIAYSFRMGDRTVSKIISEVSTAIWKTMQPLYMPLPTTETWATAAIEFEQRWQFPHCIGAIDGKHIVMKKSSKCGSSVINPSLILMAVADANYKFTFIDMVPLSRFSHANILSSCSLTKKLLEGTLKLPNPAKVDTLEKPLPYVFVGNWAFPLSNNLMRPYPRKSVVDKHKVFNYRLSRAQQTIERTFSKLVSRFHIFNKPFETTVYSVDRIVKAVCVLHNYLRHSGTSDDDDADMNLDDITCEMPDNQLLPIQDNNSRYPSSAFFVREMFTDYFNGSGSLPFQDDSIY